MVLRRRLGIATTAAEIGAPASVVTLPVTVAESATAGVAAGMTMPSAPVMPCGAAGGCESVVSWAVARRRGSTITCPSVSRYVNGTSASSCWSACSIVASSQAQRSDRSRGSRLGLYASGTPERRSSSPSASASETSLTRSRAGRSRSVVAARVAVAGGVCAVAAPPVIGVSNPLAVTASASERARAVWVVGAGTVSCSWQAPRGISVVRGPPNV